MKRRYNSQSGDKEKREQNIKFLRSIQSGEITIEQLQQAANLKQYRLTQIGDTDTYLDDLSGTVMSLAEINALPKPIDETLITRINIYTNGTDKPPCIITINPGGNFLKKSNAQ